MIKRVDAGKRKDREIKAMKLTFNVYQGDKAIFNPPSVQLLRGEAMSLFVYGNVHAPKSVWINHDIEGS